MKNFLKQYSFYFLIVIFVLVLVAGSLINKRFQSNNTIQSNNNATISESVEQPTQNPMPTSTTNEATETAEEIPTSYQIENFPLQPQAPFANWDQTHDEACEEAAVILVQWWKNGKDTITAQEMDSEILKMVSWQEQNFGGYHDLNAAETVKLAHDFYGLELTPKYNITTEDIKREVVQGNPVILPTAGRLLGNPYFRSPGPIYHMVVATGYKGNNIIVQDVGTKRGEN